MNNSLFNISHEIKNSLAVVKGYMSLLDGTKEKYDKYIPCIEKSLNHSINLLEDFSCLGKLKYSMDILDINYLIEDIVKDYKNISEINIQYETKEEEIYIMGDYNRLKEVIINAIKNACEALEGITNPEINILSYIKDDKAIIEIIDNGIGIDDDILSRLGNPFITTKENGTGLGVYISKEIINAHKGIITYESKDKTKVKIKLDLLNLVKF